MSKNLFILEDKFPLYKTKISDGIKKKCIPFSYISFLFISSLLISNLYYTKKLLNYQEKKDMQFSKNENTLYRNFYENKFEKDKEFDNKYTKENINLKSKFTNFNNIFLEATDLNILQIIENEIKGIAQLFFYLLYPY